MDTTSSQRINHLLNSLVLVLIFAIPVYRKWVVIVAPLVIILWFFDGRLRAKLASLRRHPLTVAVVAFIALNALSLLWSDNRAAGLEYLTKYRYLLLLPVIASSLRMSHRRRAELAFLAGTGLSLLLSFGVALGLFRIGDAYPGNPSPTMSHLDYSMVLAVAALVVVNRLAVGEMTAGRRLAWLAGLAAIFAGLMINIGRSGQVAFAGTLLAMAPCYLARRRRWTVAAVAAAVIVAMAAGWLAVPRFRHRLAAAVTELRSAVDSRDYDSNTGKRVAGIIVGFDVFTSHPLLGTGIGDNMDEFRGLLDGRHRELRDVVYWFPHLHNQYLQIATELGLAGLAIFAWMFYCLMRGPYASRDDHGMAVALGCAFLIGSVGDPYLHKQLPLVLFATLGGLASARDCSRHWELSSSAD